MNFNVGNFIQRSIFIARLYILSLILSTQFVHAQSAANEINTGSLKFGPFISNFDGATGFKSGSDAENKAKALFDFDGIQSDINFAMSGPREGLFIVSWQFFDSPMAFSAGQLSSDVPQFEGVKKADTKVSSSATSNSNRIEYAVIRATGGSNDGLTFSSKGKTRLVGYWVNLPIQYKNPNNELTSGMLTVFYRGVETESKKIKIDSIIASFLNSLEFSPGITPISYEKYKAEVTKEKIRKELEKEMSSKASDTSGKDTKDSSSSNSVVIKEIYAVDQDGNCYRPTEKEGLKKVTCPVHKSK